MISIDKNPSAGKLKQFAGALLIFSILWGGFHYRFFISHPAAITGLAGLCSVGALGILYPQWMRWPFIALCLVTYPMGLILSFCLLAAVFYFLVTPLGFLLRLVGWDPLRLGRVNASSYWIPKEPVSDMAYYLKQ